MSSLAEGQGYLLSPAAKALPLLSRTAELRSESLDLATHPGRCARYLADCWALLGDRAEPNSAGRGGEDHAFTPARRNPAPRTPARGRGTDPGKQIALSARAIEAGPPDPARAMAWRAACDLPPRGRACPEACRGPT